MIYLDANVFLNAILNKEKLGEKARDIIQKLQKGEIAAATSALSFDEIFWIVKKHRDFNKALKATKAFLEIPNLTFLQVDDQTLWSALNLAEKHKLAPRDAIHLACALNHGIFTIISEDKDFDRIKEIKRRKILDFNTNNNNTNPTTHPSQLLTPSQTTMPHLQNSTNTGTAEPKHKQAKKT